MNHHGAVNEDGLNIDITGATFTPHDVEFFEHNTKNLTEELDFSSKPGGPLDWIVGAFFLKGKTTVAYDQYNLLPGDPTYNGIPAPNLLNAHPDLTNMMDPLTSFLLATDVNDTSVLGDQLYFQNNGVETRNSTSGYGQAIWHATDALRLTLGGRFTRDHNTTYFSDYYSLFAPATFVQQTETKSHGALVWTTI